MSNVVVVEPRSDDLLVSLDLVKKHLRVDHADEDDLIEVYVRAIESWLDGPAGWLGRALGHQVLRMDITPTSDGSFSLPFPPATEIMSVLGPGGEIVGDGVYYLAANRVRLMPGQAWPTSGALTIVFAAGYDGDSLPKAIVAAIILMVGDLYAFRETAVIGTVSADIKMSANAHSLLTPYRVWTI